MSSKGGPGLLRALAWLVVRGADGAFIRTDIDDAFERDRARGLSIGRARWRYLLNVLASAGSVWRAGLTQSGVGFSWLDVKLGVRMLGRHPGLTSVAVFALAIGIPVGLAPQQVANALESPLPVDDGHRIQALRFWNTSRSSPESPTSFDLDRWRRTLTAFEALGAMRMRGVVLGLETGAGTVTPAAEVTASTFEILRVSPLLGRTLTPADEGPGAPNVIVIGADVWRSHFGSDPAIIGREVRIGRLPHTIVGVMPDGFLFPFRQGAWLPLRLPPPASAADPIDLRVFGRLVDGVSPDQAQAEVAVAGRRPITGPSDETARLEPEVLPFAFTLFAAPRGGLRSMLEFQLVQLLALAVLIVACTNVGLLIFARTAARSSELAVRTALGASRLRVLSQLFTESLVLAVVAAGAGLLLIEWLSGLVPVVMQEPLPYFMYFGVTRSTIVWALVLATFSAVIAGVVPALKVTGRGALSTIQQTGSTRSIVRAGRMTGALIVVDVAVAVAVIGLVAGLGDRITATWAGRDGVGIRADEFLSVQIGVPSGSEPSDAPEGERQAARQAAVAAVQQALVARLEAEPGVRGVALGSVLPRMDHPIRWAQIDGADTPDEFDGRQIRTAHVATTFFDALDQPILSGRGFDASDLAGARTSVIVNTTFVENVLGGQDPIGRRVRYRAWDGGPGPWFEIVGVVGQIGMHALQPERDAGLYHPLAFGEIDPARLAIHVGDDPASFAPRLREIVAGVEPAVIIGVPSALDRVFEGDWYIATAVGVGLLLLVGILFGLAACGIYAILSFSVAERTREIGVRMALGARSSEIAFAVARRSLTQIALGVALGLPLAWRIFVELLRNSGSSHAGLSGSVFALALGFGVIVVIALVACTGPLARALRITPVEALRAD